MGKCVRLYFASGKRACLTSAILFLAVDLFASAVRVQPGGKAAEERQLVVANPMRERIPMQKFDKSLHERSHFWPSKPIQHLHEGINADAPV